jgi:hypothetical protein
MQEVSMIRKASLIAAASAALLLGAAPVYALDISLGGASANGSGPGDSTSVSVGLGDTQANVTLGGSPNIASVGVGTGGNDVGLNVGNTSGPLLTTSTTNGIQGDVNLGSLGLDLNGPVNGVTGPVGDLLDGVDVPGTPSGPGAGGGGGIAAAFGGLSAGDQRAAKIRCANVLAAPAGYTANTLALCRLIARL